MSVREQLNAIALQRILILDGAMGSMIQKQKLSEADFRGARFANHKTPLSGCNEALCLTMPEAISAIHEAYLKAGADIIETCTLNATSVCLNEYGLGGLAYEISREGALIARKAADKFSTKDRPRFVAGSIGSTAKSASIASDINDPAKRDIYWDDLDAAYYDNARGLLDGGVDILLLETMFDTLNIKAALFAVSRLFEERKINIPIMVSATIAGNSGRLLSGQTLEALCVSVLHSEPWALGLNCSFGAEKLLPPIRRLSAIAPCMISAYPNAGLPNQFGGYDEGPETMAAHIERYLQDGLVNIVGGCCGSTPEHIAAIAAKAALYQPRILPQAAHVSNLAGLELLEVGRVSVGDFHLTLIGERTNVAGSRKFLRLIKEEEYDESLEFACSTIEDGAAILDVGMDDALLDAEQSMRTFLNYALFDPNIARVPIMIDSSRWNVIEAGLKCLQGKGLVNSINLKDGEAEFLRRASLVRRYGAALVVQLIDEKGQAVSFERKIEIAARAYRLLAGIGFPPEDTMFDPNVLAVATGIAEYDSCALDFIRACAWIRDNCPGVQISGGISNLSYSFRGNKTLREAMHSVFLKHAGAAGLSMAIVNPATLAAYNDIEENLRTAVEDLILNRVPNAADKLLILAEKIQAAASDSLANARQTASPGNGAWRNLPVEDRVIHAMVHGIDDFIEADVLELKKNCGKSALEIIEGPLLDGMKEVGKRFDKGTMYLPQVIRSAQVMKKAAVALEPYMEKSGNAISPKIIFATVKGDVHDIGKNIVGMVLACNGCQIIDLGVMVPAELIIEAAEKEQAAMIGLSALIAPSLDEMANVAREMEKRNMKIPLLVGGAATSLIHTSLRLAPEYSGPVVYVPNAGKAAETVQALLSATERPRFLRELENSYQSAAGHHAAIHSRVEILPIEAARANKTPVAYAPVAPKTSGIIELNDYPLEQIIPFIDWNAFLQGWEAGKAHGTLLEDTQSLLDRVKTEKLLQLRGVAGIFPAAAEGDDVVIGGRHRLCFLRSQHKKPAGIYNACLADFIAPRNDWLGLFALSAGFGIINAGIDNTQAEYQRNHDEYHALLLASLANALAEAFSSAIHHRFRREWWGYAPDESPHKGIRPAFGYPACPDHEDKRIAFDLLEAEQRCGLKLTDTAMIIPAASVCGMIFASPAAHYFGIGTIGEDQLIDWAQRKGINTEEARLKAANIQPSF
ncbi:MAG: methionine synthase [Treponema sp.]|jgi:5-methyltetrahydrofolate--homocysteine methyltransferase|nr:methionine synthase [Treponema sp.]